jgi:hypothetical protein
MALVSMSKLTPRYTRQELATLVELIYPEEHRRQFTREPWTGEGFRHYLDPRVTCLEHYMPSQSCRARSQSPVESLPPSWGPPRLISLKPPLAQAIDDASAIPRGWA